MSHAVVHIEASRDADECVEPLLYAFLERAQKLQARIERALCAVGLSSAKYGPLLLLSRSAEPLALNELASSMSCVRSNVTKLADRLEADGLIRRMDDPSDRRVTRVELTARGRERQAAGARQLEKIQAEFAAMLSERDRAALERLLARLA